MPVTSSWVPLPTENSAKNPPPSCLSSVVQCLLGMCQVLGSIPSTRKERKKRGRKRGREEGRKEGGKEGRKQDKVPLTGRWSPECQTLS